MAQQRPMERRLLGLPPSIYGLCGAGRLRGCPPAIDCRAALRVGTMPPSE
jgi:hypothetical protein